MKPSRKLIRNSPFLFKHFRDVANSFVQYSDHSSMHSAHLLMNKREFVHILVWCLDGIMNILEGHVQEQGLFWVMLIQNLLYPLMKS